MAPVIIELNEEQRQTLASSEGRPAMVIDPKTKEAYFLIRSPIYEQIQHLLQDDTALSKRDVAVLVARAMAEYDADDPTLELYQGD
jgi:hypothetical protein